MVLKILDNKFRIKIANDDLFNSLSRYSVKSVQDKVKFQISVNKKLIHLNYVQDIYFLKDLDIWFCYIKKYNRHIYAFGPKNPEIMDDYSPFCVVDFTTSGIENDASAVFAQDKHGRVSALYRINENLTESFVLDFERDRILVNEDGKDSYFLCMGELSDLNFIKDFQKFITDLKIISLKDDLEGNLIKKSCENCGNAISSVKSDINLINELHLKNDNLCKSCLEKSAAEYVIEKINKRIDLQVFNKSSLLERVDEPDLYESYIQLLLQWGYLKEINKDLFIFNKKELKELKSNSNIEKVEDIKEEANIKEEQCVKCGVVLSSKNSIKSGTEVLSDKCKDCSRKIYAVKALKHLEEYVDPEVPFNKNDLFKQTDDRIRFLDYIWTLEEFDLLEKEGRNDFYILKPEDKLNKFKEKYGEEIKKNGGPGKETAPPKKKKSQKVVKECEVCHQRLPVSNFYKSEDGYTDKCKKCSRKAYANKALTEIKKYVVPGVEFFKNDLVKQFENSTQILDYFWTLQDFDLIEHNEKNNTYTLKSENTPKGDVTDNMPSGVSEEGVKTVKECLTCKKILPVSNFYKSSESDDGHTVNCKKCSDKLNAATILSEIKNHIGIGITFTKKDLLNRINNPNKVNYYLWILLEHDLIDDDSNDTFIVEDNEKYQEYIKLIDKDIPGETHTTSIEEDTTKHEEDSIIKDIIYVSEKSTLNNYRTVVLRGIIHNNQLYSILEEIKGIVTSNMTNMNFDRYREDLIKIILELDVEDEKFEETLDYLHSHQWKKF